MEKTKEKTRRSWSVDDKIGIIRKHLPQEPLSTPEEQKAVAEFKKEYMCLGYVRLAWMMIDRNIAFLSPSSVYRILVSAPTPSPT